MTIKFENLNYIGDFEKSKDIRKNISIVGTRKSSAYGRFLVESLIKYLSQFELNIVSGLATGIDSMAHELALENNLATIAVLGSGLENLDYLDKAQRKVFDRIKQGSQNLIISQFPAKQPAGIWTFPLRNKVIAALSQATIVVEAGINSGSLITANDAITLGRTVLTFPGELWKDSFKGNNLLLSKKQALPILDLKDLETFLELKSKKEFVRTKSFQVDLFEDHLFQTIGDEPKNLDELQLLTKLNASELLTQLTLLEAKGLIKKHPGMSFSRKS